MALIELVANGPLRPSGLVQVGVVRDIRAHYPPEAGRPPMLSAQEFTWAGGEVLAHETDIPIRTVEEAREAADAYYALYDYDGNTPYPVWVPCTRTDVVDHRHDAARIGVENRANPKHAAVIPE